LIFDEGANDFGTLDGDVAVWNVAAPATPVVSGAISAAGAPIVTSASAAGDWREVDVADTLLLSGVTYRIAADGIGTADFGRTDVTPILNGITLTTTASYFQSATATAGPDYPATSVPNAIAPIGIASFTFEIAAIPEASAWMLAGVPCLALAATALFRRFKKHAATVA
jgi:hypothetical protein